MFRNRNPQRISRSLELLGLPSDLEDKSYILDEISKYIFERPNTSDSAKGKKNFDLNYDYKYYFPDFLKYGINLNKQDIDWWEFNSILEAILLDEKSNMKRVLNYRNYEKPIKNEKTRESIKHQQMMKLKRKYSLPSEYEDDSAIEKLWGFLEKKVGETQSKKE